MRLIKVAGSLDLIKNWSITEWLICERSIKKLSKETSWQPLLKLQNCSSESRCYSVCVYLVHYLIGSKFWSAILDRFVKQTKLLCVLNPRLPRSPVVVAFEKLNKLPSLFTAVVKCERLFNTRAKGRRSQEHFFGIPSGVFYLPSSNSLIRGVNSTAKSSLWNSYGLFCIHPPTGVFKINDRCWTVSVTQSHF